MNLLSMVNDKYKFNRESLQKKGLQDSNYWDGLWIRPYVDEYLEDGSLNSEWKNFRSLTFNERGYYFLGHGNGLSFNITAENTEVVVDSTKEKIYLKGATGLEINVEIVNKFSKLLAKLGITGTVIKNVKSIEKTTLASPVKITQEESKILQGKSLTFSSPLLIDASLLDSENGQITIFFNDKQINFTEVFSPSDLKDNTYFIDKKENNIFFIPAKDGIVIAGTFTIFYTGDIIEVLVGYGGESKENKFFNIVQIYTDPQSGKTSYREAFKCVVDPSRTISFRGQNATDGGSTASLKFNASEDVTRPSGQQLFIEKDDWDTSDSGDED